jgi:hypothetical protein
LRLNKSIAFSPLLCQKDDRDSDISTLDVLGSIMILAEEKIHPLILLEIKEWVDYIYLSIRDLENNLVSEDIGKQEGRVEDYRVQAHETKDYVNLIRNDTPEQLLEMTRDYFSTLYAASSDEFVDYYEKYLKEKNAVGDILKEAIWFALRLWLAIPMLKICGDFQEEWLNDKVDEYFQKYFKNGIDGLKKVIIKTNDKECLWYFFCALIALNKNILKNSEALWEKIQDSGSKEIEGSVEFQLSHDYKTLIVFNKYIKGKQGIDPNKYGTEKVLVHYAVKYKKKDFNNKDVGMKLDGPVKTVLGNNVYKFMTRIPILE